MHMADALLSPAVGSGFWLGSFTILSFAAKKLRDQANERLIPLMGVLGAFVFAGQMINFTIPGTGSSGHLGGGMLLSIILGPHAAFIVIASVLTVQALFFADGGLLALGSNIWNLGVYPCFIAYPLIYRSIVNNKPSLKRITAGAILASVFALQLGALSVVLQTKLSGIAELSFNSFLLIMQPIHLAIGIVEGVITAAVVNYVRILQPDIFERNGISKNKSRLKSVYIAIIASTIVLGGVFSWFASTNPDGLEWSIEKIYGSPHLPQQDSKLAQKAAEIQDKTAYLPDYKIPAVQSENKSSEWPMIDTGTSLSGLLGSLMIFGVLMIAGIGIRYIGRKKTQFNR